MTEQMMDDFKLFVSPFSATHSETGSKGLTEFHVF